MDLRIEGRAKSERDSSPIPLGEGYTSAKLTVAHR